MVRADLVDRISNQLDTTDRNAEKILTAVLDSIVEGIKEDGFVVIRSFGRFVVQDKKERMGRNPKTGEKAIIEARKRVAFKSSKKIKEILNGNRNGFRPTTMEAVARQI
jgi:DNA-binding protein HU-beta